MPHCIIEHSVNIKSESLMTSVFDSVLASGLFAGDGSDIKVRSQPYTAYQVGAQQASFVHVVLKILSGRSGAQKTALSEKVLKSLKSLGYNKCSVTVEVVDIDRSSYAKNVC